ncbi:uncharacterized protein CTRU02_211342 [Colletotrichum truncatum]|uniref:Uncharacterized protein n=1 Tax=Colletotrichum truncatum TaxID=5467 RepID=A0ACC3YRI8_COLTU|nr:uncharacterized protein CTRU02_02119 [Colletotrichum truncatum]KAF6799248.1 hypothetical protein CTRU02_02119 [Colletotrichum truncatum]
MSYARALAVRRFAAARPLPLASTHVAVTRQVRWTTSRPDNDDGDLGGPGGQEPVPSNSGMSQSWPTLAAIGGVGLLVGGYLVHLTGKPKGQTTTVVHGGELDRLAENATPRK